LRFMIQLNAPAFLDYNTELKEDYKVIHRSMQNSNQQEIWMDYFTQFERLNKQKVSVAVQIS